MRFYLAVHKHVKNTWISPTLLHIILYHDLYQYSDPLPSALR